MSRKSPELGNITVASLRRLNAKHASELREKVRNGM
jgi:hypothetical protein